MMNRRSFIGRSVLGALGIAIGAKAVKEEPKPLEPPKESKANCEVDVVSGGPPSDLDHDYRGGALWYNYTNGGELWTYEGSEWVRVDVDYFPFQPTFFGGPLGK